MDLRQLEILQAIAETGSFTACGRKLNVSQSAISRQILLLEEELGEPLFLRVGRQVRMTPAAESLVQLGQRVFQDVRDTVGAITDRTRDAARHAAPRGRHDGLPVRVSAAAEAPEARASAARRPADRGDRRALGRGDPRAAASTPACSRCRSMESDLVTVPVLREELLLVTMPTHPLAQKRTDRARATSPGQPFMLFEPGSATRTRHRLVSSLTEKIEPTIVMDTENVEIIKAMVKTGLGIGIVPYQAIAREVRAGQFFCARIEGHELVRETGWVYARANRVPRMIDELLTAFNAIRERLRLVLPRARRKHP